MHRCGVTQSTLRNTLSPARDQRKKEERRDIDPAKEREYTPDPAAEVAYRAPEHDSFRPALERRRLQPCATRHLTYFFATYFESLC